MRKTILSAALVGAGVAMGSGIASAQPVAPPTVEDYLFFDSLAAEDMYFLVEDMPEASQKGRAVCRVLDTGSSYDMAAGILFGSTDLEMREAMLMVAAAVVAYCPTHLPPSPPTRVSKLSTSTTTKSTAVPVSWPSAPRRPSASSTGSR